MWRKELLKNKLYAVAFIFLGALSIPIEWDATFFLIALLAGAVLFFSKENLWVGKENNVGKWEVKCKEQIL